MLQLRALRSDADGVLHCTLPTCAALHAPCTGADDTSCCSGTVCTFNGTDFSCEVPVSCKVNGLPCTLASDCCSNNCSANVCAPPCASTNGACTADGDCCAGLFCSIPPGKTGGTCQPVATCAPTGGNCVTSTDCCNSPIEACVAGTCAVPPTCKAQYQRCTADADCCTVSPALSCISSKGAHPCPPGDTSCVCDSCAYFGGSCSATNPCCIGLACNSGLCGSCGTVGSSCSATSPCCSGLPCVDRATGAACSGGACACESCTPLGQACTTGGTTCCGVGTGCLDSSNNGCSTATGCTCKPLPG